MTVVVITPPNEPFVSLEEVKLALRVTDDDDNEQITALLWSAQSEFGPPDGWLGRAIGEQELELRLNGFPCREIVIPFPPLIVDDAHPLEVFYIDTDGEEQTFPSDAYSIVGEGGRRPARLALAYGQSWPGTRCQREAVRVRYFAGYQAEDPDAERIKQAIKLHVGMHLDDTGRTEELRRSIDALLSTLRVW